MARRGMALGVRKASGTMSNIRRSKSPVMGFFSSKTRANRASGRVGKKLGKPYTVSPGYLVHPK